MLVLQPYPLFLPAGNNEQPSQAVDNELQKLDLVYQNPIPKAVVATKTLISLVKSRIF